MKAEALWNLASVSLEQAVAKNKSYEGTKWKKSLKFRKIYFFTKITVTFGGMVLLY